MTSVRLGEELEKRLNQAAQISGQSASDIIRDAIRQRCDELLGDNLADRLADVIGVVSSKGTSSRDTGKAFTEILDKKHKKRRII